MQSHDQISNVAEEVRFARLSQWMFVSLPIVLVLGSITPPSDFNWFPTTVIFEIVFYGTVLLPTLLLPSRKYIWIWSTLIVWLGYRFFASILSDDPTPFDEFFRAHKWIFYIIVLISALKFKIIEAKKLNLLVNFILVASLIKYIYVLALAGFVARPGIFTENNYELFLLFGLLIVVYELGFRKNFWFISALLLVVLLSGSRSGATGLLVLVLYLATKSEARTTLVQYLVSIGVYLTGGLALLVFQSRGTNLETIDRVNFLGRFWIEVSQWTFFDWFFGSPPLTRLSYETCTYLSFYSGLLSSSGDGSCYSVILHSQILRLVFDFGLSGLILCFALILYILRASGMNWAPSLALLGLALANSFSVSGPNNVYVMMPILAAVITKHFSVETAEPYILVNRGKLQNRFR